MVRAESDWRVGLSSARITPDQPLPMCGYNPNVSEGVLDDLYAKAMAIEDADGSRALLLTADLLFFRAPLADVLCGEISERTGLRREQILLNASHTHAGPVFGIEDPGRFDLAENQRQRVRAYTEKLIEQLVDLYLARHEMNCSCPWDRNLVHQGGFADGRADEALFHGRTEVKDGVVPSAFVGGRAADCGRGTTGASPRTDAAENGGPMAAAPWAHPRKGREDRRRRLGDRETIRQRIS
jgi:hypothetical protein